MGDFFEKRRSYISYNNNVLFFLKNFTFAARYFSSAALCRDHTLFGTLVALNPA
jgi:hypothetical protein